MHTPAVFAINHAATALVLKRRYPQVPWVWALVSVQLVEMLWVAFNLVGLERTTTEATVSTVRDVHLAHMPWSHSLLTTVLLCFAAWGLLRGPLRRPALAVPVALGVASHFVLDLITHAPDLALAPLVDGPKLGLGLYQVPPAALAVETAYGVLCWWVYGGRRALLAVIVGFNLANLTLFTPIPGPEGFLAGHPTALVLVVAVQIVVTLVLVGWLARPGPAARETARI